MWITVPCPSAEIAGVSSAARPPCPPPLPRASAPPAPASAARCPPRRCPPRPRKPLRHYGMKNPPTAGAGEGGGTESTDAGGMHHSGTPAPLTRTVPHIRIQCKNPAGAGSENNRERKGRTAATSGEDSAADAPARQHGYPAVTVSGSGGTTARTPPRQYLSHSFL